MSHEAIKRIDQISDIIDDLSLERSELFTSLDYGRVTGKLGKIERNITRGYHGPAAEELRQRDLNELAEINRWVTSVEYQVASLKNGD